MIENIKKFIKEAHPTYNQIVDNFNIDVNKINENLLYLEENGIIDKLKNQYYHR